MKPDVMVGSISITLLWLPTISQGSLEFCPAHSSQKVITLSDLQIFSNTPHWQRRLIKMAIE